MRRVEDSGQSLDDQESLKVVDQRPNKWYFRKIKFKNSGDIE